MSSALRFPRGHSFLHIPKTGGTAIEVARAKLRIEVLTSPWTSPWVGAERKRHEPGAAWHLPPDMFAERHRRPRASKPLLCVVRDHAERMHSELAWRCELARRRPQAFPRWTRLPPSVRRCAPPRLSPAAEVLREARAVASARGNRTRLLFAEDPVLHVLPQWWFVWSAAGAVTCQCVVAYEKLQRVAALARPGHNRSRPHRAPSSSTLWGRPFSALLGARLYARDAALHRNATAARGLCYAPR